MRQGTRIGTYQILGRWTETKIDVIYAARKADDESDRRLYAVHALKFVTSRTKKELSDVVRCLRASSDRTLVIPHAVLEDQQGVYLVTDFVRGESLDVVLRAARGGLPRLFAMALAEQMGRSLLGVREAQGNIVRSFELIHGDLAPANILMSYHGGHMKITGYGVALGIWRSLGRMDRVIGHVSYLSPERVAGSSLVDERSDVYSLGIILWELLTGQKAITGTSVDEIAAAALGAKIPAPSSTGIRCGRDIDEVVLKATSKKPDDRYPSMKAMLAQLESYVGSRTRKFEVNREVEKLMTQHFRSKSRAMGTLITRWLATPTHVQSGASVAIRTPMSSRAQPALLRDPSLDGDLQGAMPLPQESSSVHSYYRTTADLPAGTEDLESQKSADLPRARRVSTRAWLGIGTILWGVSAYAALSYWFS